MKIYARKGQAALEFMMTYGWAILISLMALGALAYFGVLNPNTYKPNKCDASAGFVCEGKPAVGSWGVLGSGLSYVAFTIISGNDLTIQTGQITISPIITGLDYSPNFTFYNPSAYIAPNFHCGILAICPKGIVTDPLPIAVVTSNCYSVLSNNAPLLNSSQEYTIVAGKCSRDPGFTIQPLTLDFVFYYKYPDSDFIKKGFFEASVKVP